MNDDDPPVGYAYALESHLARDPIEMWSTWRGGRIPTAREAAAAVIHYAEKDAFQPVEEGPGR